MNSNTARLYRQWQCTAFLFCNKSVGWRAWRKEPSFRGVFKKNSDVICRVLDIRLCKVGFFFRVIYVTNRLKCMFVGGVSSNNGGRLGESEGFFFPYVRIEIEKLKCICQSVVSRQSLALRSLNLIYITTDHQPVIYYSTIHGWSCFI